MEEQLRQLANTHQILQTSTTTLSQALKSPSVLGRWGEIQLRRIVELSGMLRHVDFQEQVGSNNLRPDMVVNMPNNGILPIDSKATLKFYLEAVSSDNEDIRNTKLDSHVNSVQNHIRELSQKKYWDQFSKSPDFVVMFIPSEAGLYAAFERNPDLLNYAIEKRVLIASPMTLLALLKAIAYGWQQHQIADHIAEIVDESRELYKRLKTFTAHLGQLGKNINKLVENYNKSIGSFERRILPVSRRMQEMGLSATELISPDFLEATASIPNTDDENVE